MMHIRKFQESSAPPLTRPHTLIHYLPFIFNALGVRSCVWIDEDYAVVTVR